MKQNNVLNRKPPISPSQATPLPTAHCVGMVGDGINGAPALATANVGIAIGGGTNTLETADIVLMHAHLTHLADALDRARATAPHMFPHSGGLLSGVFFLTNELSPALCESITA